MTSPESPETGTRERRDFTPPGGPIGFTIAPDDFDAPGVISSVTLRRLGALHGALGNLAAVAPADDSQVDQLVKAMADMMRLLIPGPGGRRFAERLLSDGDPGDPEEGIPASPPIIDITTAMSVLYWLLEQYGMRPTEPSSPSLNGSTDGLTSVPSDTTYSTDTASPEVSISAN